MYFARMVEKFVLNSLKQLRCYGSPGVATILQASLVIANFKDFCPLVAFDSKKVS